MTIDTTTDSLRRDRAALEAEIRAAGSTVKGTSCNCPHPQHEDAHPSASIHADPAGVWRVTCHSRDCWGKGADLFDLRAALTGKPLADVLREARGPDTAPPSTTPLKPDMLALAKRYTAAITPEQLADLSADLGLSPDALRRLRCGWCADLQVFTFPMRDAAGNITGIRTRTLNGRKRSITGSASGLFIPADLPAGGTLYVVEGPTDCAALTDCGLSAIGRPSNTAGGDLVAEYLRLNPREAVVILADRDANPDTAANTIHAADALASRLVPLVGNVRIVQPPQGFKDVRDWRNAGATMDDVEAVADAAPSRGPAGELHAMLAAEIDGTRRAIAFPWRMVTRGTQAIIPGTSTLIVGDPGSGKSLWLLEALAFWLAAGLRVACYMLERTRAEHLKRALAQRVGAAWLTNLEQVAARPDETMAYHAEHARWLDSFGRAIFDAPGKPVTLPQLAQWIEERAIEGARVIAIDPVTLAETSDRPWDDARRFLQAAGTIIERYGASLVLVTHPAKTRGRPTGGLRTLDDLAGGSAWARFADCVLWLERHDEPRNVTIKDFGGAFPLPHEESINRTLRIMKARNGRGAGWQIAFDMDPQALRFDERGAIVKASSAEAAP